MTSNRNVYCYDCKERHEIDEGCPNKDYSLEPKST